MWSRVFGVVLVVSMACAGQQQVQVAEAPRPLTAEQRVRTKPAGEPFRLSYDLAAAAQARLEESDLHLCESVAILTKEVDELPAAERSRFSDHVKLFGNLDGTHFALRDQDWSMLLQYRQAAMESKLTSRQRHYRDAIERPREAGTDDLRAAVAVDACSGHPRKDPIAVLVQREEDARCEADAACTAERDRARTAQLQESICDLLARRKNAKDNVAEEWKYARETGLVDVNNLHDNKTLMVLYDERAAEQIQAWESRTGQKFSKKRCQ